MTTSRFRIGNIVRTSNQTLKIVDVEDKEYRVFVLYPYHKFEIHSISYLDEHGRLKNER